MNRRADRIEITWLLVGRASHHGSSRAEFHRIPDKLAFQPPVRIAAEEADHDIPAGALFAIG